ncbi:helix-turn-helix transcriptional regulator [Acidithiobacillus ferrivorans]|uniref:AlpA family phage regulatory protein n=1 Tax=Acidithiobacillus ferrivorans TaxID=160808 RepID=A0A7T4WBW6_9PROT|nr:AlpA family phage regulatory protein [Acidithiobacillus ferrivorans]
MKSEDQIQLRANGASAYCGMSRSTYLKLVSEKKAPQLRRLGPGVVIWDRVELDRWIEAGERA